MCHLPEMSYCISLKLVAVDILMIDTNVCLTAAFHLAFRHTVITPCPATLFQNREAESGCFWQMAVQQGHLVKVQYPDHVHLFAHTTTARASP